jgi:ATP-dependent helicase/nuclease subunit A
MDNKVRDIDPNVKQRIAADPHSSVWVSASAGTGKTKVLTDRVLRLLLPRRDGSSGTSPERILCITFTKAGANEMSLRIQDMLADWAILEDSALISALKKLLGYDPCEKTIQRARQLFAAVIDTPGGLKIMTIHAFCQSVLSRFPLEAKLSPSFKVIEEKDITKLLTQAKNHVVQTAHEDAELMHDLNLIIEYQNEDQFSDLMTTLNSNRPTLSRIAKTREQRYQKLCETLSLDPKGTVASLSSAFSQDESFDKSDLYMACKHLSEGGKTDIARADTVQDWLDASPEKRAQQINTYLKAFITVEETIRKTLASKKIQENYPETVTALFKEAERIIAYLDRKKSIALAHATGALLNVGSSILQTYTALKEQQSVLDFDDLIFKTYELLSIEGVSPWVMYKLDGGLDHVLVDEAQDTNPEQWQIIKHLCTDFFDGHNRQDDGAARTIFTVGDEKQSIYSFQRAEPEEFSRMKEHFENKIREAEQKWENPSLDLSFRSAPSVLRLTDEVFAREDLRKSLGRSYETKAVSHDSFRYKQAGHCEIWPLFEADKEHKDEDLNPWDPPITIRDQKSAPSKLAEHIALTIKKWLDEKRLIASKNRPIEPKDIMILVRTRTAFVNQLMKSLKRYNIPVSGLDRMKLNEQISIMDLKAAAQFALNPHDDLSLACVLKSPLIGYDDDQLYDLAIDRESSLWNSIRDERGNDWITAIRSYLDMIIHSAKTDKPSDFFQRLINLPCPVNSMSGLRAMQARLGPDCIDPIEELLNLAASYELHENLSLQGFLIAQQNNTLEIKREMEEASQEVRMMTVHAS